MTAIEPGGAGSSIPDGAGRHHTTGAPATPRQWVVPLPYLTPPLTANQRMHWRARARATAQVRLAARVAAKGDVRVPRLARCRVELHYVPQDNRRRDADNLVPTLKAVCDGLVDARVTRDDTPAYMDKTMPVIHPAAASPQTSRLYLVITDLGGAA